MTLNTIRHLIGVVLSRPYKIHYCNLVYYTPHPGLLTHFTRHLATGLLVILQVCGWEVNNIAQGGFQDLTLVIIETHVLTLVVVQPIHERLLET